MMEEDHAVYVILRRTINILHIVYISCALSSFLAGFTMVWHVDPYSECLLYSYTDGSKIYYGEEWVCETIGYLYLASIVGAVVMLYFIYKHRVALMSRLGNGQYIKPNDPIRKFTTSFLVWHVILGLFVLFLTAALTAGYSKACDNIHSLVSDNLVSKLNNDDDLKRGERFDERFVHDNQFWRYTGQINNAYGSEIFTMRITCRAVFTDPDIYKQLQETHVEKYGSYFGYWYKEDLFMQDPQQKSFVTNMLMEACLAGGWLSTLFWLGSFIFVAIQIYSMKKKKTESDRISLHSQMDGSIRKDPESMLSGSAFNGNFVRGSVLRGSDNTIRSLKAPISRPRDMDELAFAAHGIPTPTPGGVAGLQSTLNGGQSQRYDYPPMDYPPPIHDEYSYKPQTPNFNRPSAFVNPRTYETYHQQEKEHLETEIM